MLQLNSKLIGERKTPEILLRRTSQWSWANLLDVSRRPSAEKASLYMVISLQILFVLPFPALVLYYVPKPKYIEPMFIMAAIFQIFPAAFAPKNRPMIFFCLCGALLMLFEAFVYMLVTTT